MGDGEEKKRRGEADRYTYIQEKAIQETRAVFPRLEERIEDAVVRVRGEMVCLDYFVSVPFLSCLVSFLFFSWVSCGFVVYSLSLSLSLSIHILCFALVSLELG